MNPFSFPRHLKALLLLCLCAFATDLLEAQEASAFNKLPVKIVLFPFRRAVISSNVESRLLKYRYKVGETFKKADLLVELDDSDYKQIAMKGAASVSEADAASKYAQSNLKRKEALMKKGALGFQELEQSKLENATAESKCKYAKANLELAKIDLASCKIKAPFSGRITKKLREEHEHVKRGEPILEIIDDNQLLAVMHFPSKEKNKIKEGMPLKFKIDETGKTYTGKVYEISGDIDPGSRTFQVKALIDNKAKKLSAGMSGVYTGNL